MRITIYSLAFLATTACVETVDAASELDIALATMAACVGEIEGHWQASEVALPRPEDRLFEEARRRRASGVPVQLNIGPVIGDLILENDELVEKFPYSENYDFDRFNAERIESRKLAREAFIPIFLDDSATDKHLTEQATILANINAEGDPRSGLLSPFGADRAKECITASQVIIPFMTAPQ